MRRFISLVLILSGSGCSSSSSPSTNAGSGGSLGTGGSGGMQIGSGGVPGSGGGTIAGTGGTVASDAGSMGGSDAAADAINAADTSDASDAASSCPSGAIICEDFEKYSSGATDLAPDWVVYKYGGATLQVDTTKAFSGTKALHITAPIGGRKYADVIKQNASDKELLPIKHYGRAMVWLTTQPTAAHWNINQAGGPSVAGPTEIAKYSYGGQNSVLSPNYTLRPPIGDNVTPVRGGGPEDTDNNTALFDCGPNTTTQKLMNGRWVCWEWMFDGQNNQLRLYLDGVEQTQAAVNGVAGNCNAWQGPMRFTKMIIGWEQYTQASDKAQEAWLDDIVVSDQKVECPAHP